MPWPAGTASASSNTGLLAAYSNMNADRGAFIAALAGLIESQGEDGKRFIFSVLDCIKTHAAQYGQSAQSNTVNIANIVLNFTTGQSQSFVNETIAALQHFWPKPRPASPYLATGSHTSTLCFDRKSGSPLNGAALLDKRAISWKERFAEKAVSCYGQGSGGSIVPLIRNHAEARQISAEYASLEFKTVPESKGSDFPEDEEQQRKLVTLICHAIVNMKDILETRPPGTLRRGNAVVNAAAPGNDGDNAGDDDAHAHAPPAGQAALETKKPSKPKTNISIAKVKGLSCIEVELLGWNILYTTRDIHLGHLPFHNWSGSDRGRDWGWEGGFATFRDRLEAVIDTLRQSKAAVCSLLESDYLARLEAHPKRELQRKVNNRLQNAERNEQVLVGRHAINKKHVEVGAAGDLRDRDGNIVATADAGHEWLIPQKVERAEISRRQSKQREKEQEQQAEGEEPQRASKRVKLNTGKNVSSATVSAPRVCESLVWQQPLVGEQVVEQVGQQVGALSVFGVGDTTSQTTATVEPWMLVKNGDAVQNDDGNNDKQSQPASSFTTVLSSEVLGLGSNDSSYCSTALGTRVSNVANSTTTATLPATPKLPESPLMPENPMDSFETILQPLSPGRTQGQSPSATSVQQEQVSTPEEEVDQHLSLLETLLGSGSQFRTGEGDVDSGDLGYGLDDLDLFGQYNGLPDASTDLVSDLDPVWPQFTSDPDFDSLASSIYGTHLQEQAPQYRYEHPPVYGTGDYTYDAALDDAFMQTISHTESETGMAAGEQGILSNLPFLSAELWLNMPRLHDRGEFDPPADLEDESIVDMLD